MKREIKDIKKSEGGKLYYELCKDGKVDEQQLKAQLIHRRMNELLTSPKLLEAQREILKDYHKRLFSNTTKAKSIDTKKSNIQEVYRFAEFVKKPFNKVSEDDIVDYVAYCTEKGIKESTIWHRVTILKTFYKWIGLPHIVKGIEVEQPKTHIEESELLTNTEINRMIEKCHLPRDKAFIKVLYESGARITELLNTKVKDFTPDEYGGVLQIKVSKTEPRPIRLIDSAILLQEHLNHHEYRDNREAPLFYSYHRSGYGRPLKYTGGCNILKNAGKIAGITKPIRPHLMRHARLNWLAKKEGFNERELRLFAGWGSDSKMTSVYLHYGHDQVEAKLLKNKGLLKEEKTKEDRKEQKVLEPKVCPRCNKKNDPSSAYCNCGMALDLKTVMDDKKRIDSETNKTIQVLMEIMKDPEKLKKFEEFKKAKAQDKK